jgi:hypothetical protein
MGTPSTKFATLYVRSCPVAEKAAARVLRSRDEARCVSPGDAAQSGVASQGGGDTLGSTPTSDCVAKHLDRRVSAPSCLTAADDMTII